MTIKYTTRAILEMLGRIPEGGQEVKVVKRERDAARGEDRRTKRVKVEEPEMAAGVLDVVEPLNIVDGVILID